MSRLVINEEYGIILDDLLYDKRLSFRAKGLYVYLYSKSFGKSFSCVFLMKEILKQTKDGEKGIISGLKELEKLNYIRRIPVKDNEIGFKPNKY